VSIDGTLPPASIAERICERVGALLVGESPLAV